MTEASRFLCKDMRRVGLCQVVSV